MRKGSGTIKRMVRDKGFGFIQPDGGGDDLFFHRSTLVGAVFEQLTEETRVTYDVGRSAKGPRAENVEVSE